jgi:DNA-binding beta-propeller fold protein YncE
MPGPAAVQPGFLGRVRRYGAVRAIAAAVVAVGLAAGVLVLGVASALAVPAHVLSGTIGDPGFGAGQIRLAPYTGDPPSVEVGDHATSGVAVNQVTGDVYVADTENHRVDVFDPAKPKVEQFIRAFGVNVGGPGVDVCTAGCVKGTSGSSPGAFEQPLFIAIDNSTGPSRGDVYVGDGGDNLISKFTESGSLVTTWGTNGQLGGFAKGSGDFLAGVAVAPEGSPFAGSLFVADTDERRSWFNQDGSPHSSTCFTDKSIPPGIAVDTSTDLYVLNRGSVRKFTPECEQLSGGVGGDERGTDLAIDPSNNDLYVTLNAEAGEEGGIQRFGVSCDNSCEPIEEFGFEGSELTHPQGIAVNAATHTAYVADAGTDQIAVFTVQEVPPPTVDIEAASEVSYTTAKVTGKVNPSGHLTTCKFEYALDAQFEDAKSTPCSSNPGDGSSLVAVEAQLSGLRGTAEYHVRLVAENRGIPDNTTPSNGVSFHTLTVAQPTITIEPPGAITSTSAHFVGQINPNAAAGDPPAFGVNWEFECSPACPGLVGGAVVADDTSHEVSEDVTGLEPGKEYKVVLVGKNANEVPVTAGPVSFTAPAVAPRVISSTVTAASGTEATLSSQVDPGGAPTGYRYEYITEAQYDADGESFGEGTQSTPQAGPLGTPGDNQQHEATATIAGLDANTNYRFRVVAQNDIETVDGPSELLYSYSPQVFGSCTANEQLREENDSQLLPDCRAYEQVSPADNAEAFVPFGQRSESEGLVKSQWPMQAAAGGDAVSYVAEPAGSGACEGTGNAGGGEGDQYLAVRGEAGWSSCDVQPLASNAATSYQAFSKGLEASVLRTGKEEALQSGIPGQCDQLYSRSGTGPFSALFAAQSSECLDLSNFFVGGSAGYSQIAFESKEVLAAGAGVSSGDLGHENIYLTAGEDVHTVNVLPGQSPSPAADASVGGLSGEPNIQAGGGSGLPAVDTSGAVSVDGSHVFWTDLSTGIVYVRVNAAREQSEIAGGKCTEVEKACTLQVSAGVGPATYQTATPEGRYAFYTESGELWRFDLTRFSEAQQEGKNEAQADALARADLAGAGAGVQGVIGVNETGEDGAYLYFVAEGKLATGAEARKCEAAPEGALRGEEEEGKAPVGYGCNLYELHEGQTSLVAVLAAGDDEFEGNTTGTAQPKKGDWRPVAGYRSAELSADGQSLVFMSNRQLTSYQNVNRHGECGAAGERTIHSCVEIYLYSAQSNKIACASCAPSGAPPVAMKDAPNQNGEATYLPGDFGSITHMRRLISADGSRVFFDSDQALVPQDKNGVQDVYEWEQEGESKQGEGKEGRCAKGSTSNGGGCVSLLSGGSSSSGSFLLDADETGDNVFFVSRAALVPGGGNGEKPNVFDARVDGGFKGAPGGIVQPPECKSAEECKEPAGEPPVESFPASAAFSGAGNLTAPLEVLKPPAEKPAVRKLTRAQELTKALKACRKQVKRKRAGCVKQAQRRYGPIKQKAKRKRSGKK